MLFSLCHSISSAIDRPYIAWMGRDALKTQMQRIRWRAKLQTLYNMPGAFITAVDPIQHRLLFEAMTIVWDVKHEALPWSSSYSPDSAIDRITSELNKLLCLHRWAKQYGWSEECIERIHNVQTHLMVEGVEGICE